MTKEEQLKASSLCFVVGCMVGESWHLDIDLMKRWLESGQVPDDFRYEKQVRAAIEFAEKVR